MQTVFPLYNFILLVVAVSDIIEFKSSFEETIWQSSLLKVKAKLLSLKTFSAKIISNNFKSDNSKSQKQVKKQRHLGMFIKNAN